MQSEVRSLESLCSLIVDCPHSTPAWTTSGYVVLRNQNIRNGRLDLSAPSFTDAEHFAGRNRRAKPTAGDIVITREAPMGEVCMIPEGLECCLGQRQVLLRPNPDLVNPRFLFFALRSHNVQHQIGWNEGTGSTVSNLRIPVLKSLRIPLPDRKLQDDVAEILGAIDDRIDNLRQTNTTLEAIAQALFKSWFVDFDPVRAKAEGREPDGMDAATAALFPSEFEDSELGPIPKGWRVKAFGSEFDFTMGQSPPGSTYNTDGIGAAFFQGCTDFGDVSPTKRVSTTAPTRFARTGDILMSVRAPVGALNIADADCAIGRGLCAIRHKSGSTGLTIENIRACVHRIEDAAGEGALFKSLSKRQLGDLPVLSAGHAPISAAIAILGPIIDRRLLLAHEAETLTLLHDVLLPRLVSGRLRVRENNTVLCEHQKASA